MSTSASTFLPYLLRATYDWLADNDFKIYIEIDTSRPYVTVPSQFIEDNRIVLDISPQAINKLNITDEILECEARFDSMVSFVSTPLAAITAIFNPEQGYGVKFQPIVNIALPIEEPPISRPIPKVSTNTSPTKTAKPKKSKPKLTLIKKPAK